MRTTLVWVLVLASAGVASGDDKPGAMGSLTEANAKFDACASKLHKSGTAQIHLNLAKDGTTSDVKVTGTGSADLDACIAKAVSTTKFPRGIEFKLDVRMKIPTGASASANKPAGPPDPSRGQASTTELDRAAIAAGVAKVKAKITACGDASKAGGTVKASVKVAPDGKATATATGSTDAALNTCVAKAMETATFGKTTNGGAFTYPFVFGAGSSPSPLPGPPPPPPPTDKPSTGGSGLDRSMISDGIAKVKAKIGACGDGKTKGVVKIKVVVAPAGNVSAATVTQTPADALGTCVAGVLAKATFAKTEQGGSFTYPFVF